MNASKGRTRGTKRDWYNRKPSKRSFTIGMRLCERRKIRAYRMASAICVCLIQLPRRRYGLGLRFRCEYAS
jgi:hypothetical protein